MGFLKFINIILIVHLLCIIAYTVNVSDSNMLLCKRQMDLSTDTIVSNTKEYLCMDMYCSININACGLLSSFPIFF